MIPKIIHQLWIGPKPRPVNLMNTWKEKHLNFEYIFWNEEEIAKRGLQLECIAQINKIEEINGKADIIRWEILYKYGGVFIDADSICIEPLDDLILSKPCFAGYENEHIRKGLIATGTMGFPPKHNLCRGAIDFILKNPTDFQTTQQRAWQTVGPLLLTNLYKSKEYLDLHIFPSHFFLPIHYSGLTYQGHEKVYAHQEWGSTKQNYDSMTNIELPSTLLPPTEWISILVSSYNTKYEYIGECLESIRKQEGLFGIELIWINDGSDDMNTSLLEILLELFKKKSRFTKVVYKKRNKNKGIGYSLNKGVNLCSNEFIFKLDSDDIMFPTRIQTQWQFMKEKNCVMCGSNVKLIQEQNNQWVILGETNHSLEITLEQYKTNKLHWIMNHPSICFKKEAILSVGNYNSSQTLPLEDLELELKVLKKYGILYNIKECLVLYRVHRNQVTYNGKTLTPELIDYRNKMINNIID